MNALGSRPTNQRILIQSLIVASAALTACALPAHAGAKSKAALRYPDGSPMPMTPWGAPDLQGMWPITHLIATPLQRKPKYGTQRYLTDAEWKKAEGILKRRYERYDSENRKNELGMGSWAESTLRSQAARLTSLISYPPNGRIPPLTPYGKKLAHQFHSDDFEHVFNSPKDFDAWDRCITRGMPESMLPVNYNNGIQIVQSPGYVVIRLEMIHESRIIPIDSKPLDPAVEQWLGASRGHWEGPTLVVETTNFNGKVAMTNVGTPGAPHREMPTTPDMKITERFTRVSHDQINYRMTVEDPKVLTDKWTVSYPMFLDPKYQFFEYACLEGDSAIRHYIEMSRYERGLKSPGKSSQ